MAAIDNLNTEVARNTELVGTAVAHMGTAGNEVQVQAAADTLKTNNDALAAATPPAL